MSTIAHHSGWVEEFPRDRRQAAAIVVSSEVLTSHVSGCQSSLSEHADWRAGGSDVVDQSETSSC